MFLYKFCVILCVIFTSFLNADNILHLPPQKTPKSLHKAYNADSTPIALQIQALEKNSKNIDEYTTKYFKKRNYSAPFSSEAKDYQDSILIKRERKVPKKSDSVENRADSKSVKNTRDSTKSLESKGDFADSTKSKSDSTQSTFASLALPQPFLLPSKKPRHESKGDFSDSTDSSKSPDSIESQGDSTHTPPKIYNKILDTQKPKVVIIIDDIATPKQLGDIEALQSAGLKLTPSIFPVAQNNAQMLERVANLDFFMVHLPLEALAYKDELDTINIYDSKEAIEAKIARIKRILPRAHYINNHTGSKFTERRDNMEILLSVLDSHNINFVDSRTTPHTTIPSIAKAQNRLILYRDIFIDNALDSHSLNTQINEGVKIAKARGYAILIAHPHKETLNAIRAAKNGALREVDVIYLNELDYLLKKSNITQYAQVLKSP